MTIIAVQWLNDFMHFTLTQKLFDMKVIFLLWHSWNVSEGALNNMIREQSLSFGHADVPFHAIS